MTKRKTQLADRLSNTAKPGWRDIINTPQQVTPAGEQATPASESTASAPINNVPREAAPRYKRKTYLISPDMITRIEGIADSERVGINELVRYMLDHALTQIESGEHAIPTTDGRRAISS